jgi:hypothetical protein
VNATAAMVLYLVSEERRGVGWGFGCALMQMD